MVSKTKLSKKHIDVTNKVQIRELMATVFRDLDPPTKKRKMKQIQEVCENI